MEGFARGVGFARRTRELCNIRRRVELPNWLGCGRAFWQKKHDHDDDVLWAVERTRRCVVFIVRAAWFGVDWLKLAASDVVQDGKF